MKNMHSVSDEDCDKLFRDKLYSFETEPSDKVWGSITEQLNSGKKIKSFPILRVAAASMAAAIGFGMWLAATKEPMKLSGTAKNISVSLTQETRKVSVPPSNTVTENATVQIASKEVKEVVPVSVASTIARKSQTREEKVVATVNAKQLREKEDIKSPEIKEQPEIENESLTTDKQAPSMALVSQSVIESEENEPPLRPVKIRSVGSLVNFVVSKVDKRKNKIIEFKEGDEGVVVSGIDLGLLKYKSKDK